MKLQQRIPALEGKTVIFFDGVCDLCNATVQFIIRHDKQKRFHFASLQSAIGQQVLQDLPSELRNIDSILLYTNHEVYLESGAAIRIIAMLRGVWNVTQALLVIPAGIRNFFYRIIARNRYSWFGRRDECMVPTPELRSRFLN